MASTAERQVLNYIESTFNKILHEISQPSVNGKPVISLNRIASVQPYHDEEDSGSLKWHIESRQVSYHFPGKNKDEAWRFACVGRILGEIHGAIRQGVTITKRDIYYHDPSLFKTQETIDRYVDDIAYTCQVTRRDLHVVASPKGLVAGLRQAPANGEASIIQTICDSSPHADADHLNWILVVEKEATFNALVEREFYQQHAIGRGLLITAKGYPDVATKSFLRRILDHATFSVPVYGLFDWDPDGVRILKSYLYGSKRLAQEHECNIPELKWIGIKAADLGMPRGNNASISMSQRDRSAAVAMLASPEWRDQTGEGLPGLNEAFGELRHMLMLNRKAEIQSLDETDTGLEDWLQCKLKSQLCL